MAFSSVTWTNMDNFVTQMDTFLVANGWTQDDLDTSANEAAWHKGTVFFQITWDEVNRMAVFQSLSYDGSAPGANPDDAGPLGGTDREVLWSNGPGQAEFFSGTEAGAEFFFAAIEYAPGQYAYLGAGELIKKGDWTGGEWVATSEWGIGGGALDDPFNDQTYVLIDGRSVNSVQAATIHQEGWPGQVAGRKWGAIGGNMTNTQDDRAGNDRDIYLGGLRGGFIHEAFDYLDFQPNAGFIPLQTIEVWRRPTSTRLAGFIPGLRGLKITNVDVREELPFGLDTWKAYPWHRKSSAGGGQAESQNHGLAFLKIP